MIQTHPYNPPHQLTRNWDLKLAAFLFISACLTMSLILPNLDAPQIQMETPTDWQKAPSSVEPEAATITIPSSPQQNAAALESYKKGLSLLKLKKYQDAAAEFKRALEKSVTLTAAYVGLADAFNHLGNFRAAETNARHALSKLKILGANQAPDSKHKEELTYAHQVLGIALLNLAKGNIKEHKMTTARMQALEASSNCNLAAVFDQNDHTAKTCAKQADSLSAR